MVRQIAVRQYSLRKWVTPYKYFYCFWTPLRGHETSQQAQYVRECSSKKHIVSQLKWVSKSKNIYIIDQWLLHSLPFTCILCHQCFCFGKTILLIRSWFSKNHLVQKQFSTFKKTDRLCLLLPHPNMWFQPFLSQASVLPQISETKERSTTQLTHSMSLTLLWLRNYVRTW